MYMLTWTFYNFFIIIQLLRYNGLSFSFLHSQQLFPFNNDLFSQYM